MPCDPNQQAVPTTASYSKAVTYSLFGQERGLVRKVEPSLRVRKVGMPPRSSGNEANSTLLPKIVYVFSRNITVFEIILLSSLP